MYKTLTLQGYYKRRTAVKYLVWSIIPIAIYVLYYFAMKKSLASHVANLTKEQFIIRPPRMYIAVSAITSLVFTVFFRVLHSDA